MRKAKARLEGVKFAFAVLRRSPLSIVGVVIALGYLFLSLFGFLITPYDPLEINLEERLQPPSMSHLAGTDEFGRDVFSRILAGSSYSAKCAVMVLSVSAIVGVVLGAISGYYRGLIDEALMRFTDVFMVFPPLLLAIAICAALGPSLFNVMIALTIIWWPRYARIVRGMTLSLREMLFVEAAKSIGVSNLGIIIRHIVPNSLASIIVMLTMDVGYVILNAAALSFLGFGVRPPQPEWGNIVSEGRSWFPGQWWISIGGGVAIFIVVLGFNILGDFLRDATDPRFRRMLELKIK